MAVEMMDTIEQFHVKVKVNLGKEKMLAKTESLTSTKASINRDWVVDPMLPEGWKVSFEMLIQYEFHLHHSLISGLCR